jgi:3-oxoacyl-[acyl-carrier-protein] synthase-3
MTVRAEFQSTSGRGLDKSSPTPDQVLPAAACMAQHPLGAKQAAAFNLNATCSGFLYASTVATGMITSGTFQRVLVIGSDTLSRFTDCTYRNACVLFGDGAGAAVFTPRRNGTCVLFSKIYADGEHGDATDSACHDLPASPLSCATRAT